jgi:hypothetical protein
MNLIQLYSVFIIVPGLFFYWLDKQKYACTNTNHPAHTNVVHLLHQFFAQMAYVGSFVFPSKYTSIHLFLIVSHVFIILQYMFNQNKQQSCILMTLYNNECEIEDKDRYLVDLLHVTGIKQLPCYHILYYSLIFAGLVVSVIKLKKLI